MKSVFGASGLPLSVADCNTAHAFKALQTWNTDSCVCCAVSCFALSCPVLCLIACHIGPQGLPGFCTVGPTTTTPMSDQVTGNSVDTVKTVTVSCAAGQLQVGGAYCAVGVVSIAHVAEQHTCKKGCTVKPCETTSNSKTRDVRCCAVLRCAVVCWTFRYLQHAVHGECHFFLSTLQPSKYCTQCVCPLTACSRAFQTTQLQL